MNPNEEFHDLNPDCSYVECMLFNCSWVNQAQLKNPGTFTVMWCKLIRKDKLPFGLLMFPLWSSLKVKCTPFSSMCV